MKQLFRITLLLIGFIWILAWAAAGRFGDAPTPSGNGEPPAQAGEPAAPGERDSADLLHVLIRGEVQEMDMGTYLLGVLRAEMPASFEEEALKAQAIAARTYTHLHALPHPRRRQRQPPRCRCLRRPHLLQGVLKRRAGRGELGQHGRLL